MKSRTTLAAIAFLTLCALANIIVGHFGPEASPIVAFAVVGPILVLRDALHEAWADRGHVRFLANMAGLVVAGAALAYVTGPDAGNIAIASCAAFAASLTVDTAAYALLRRTAEHVRVNVSNAVSALADSLVFIWVAFGLSAVQSGLVFNQFLAKVAGGALFLATVGYLLHERRAANEQVAA